MSDTSCASDPRPSPSQNWRINPGAAIHAKGFRGHLSGDELAKQALARAQAERTQRGRKKKKPARRIGTPKKK